MKYLIPLSFLLLIFVITVFNSETPEPSIDGTKRPWQQWNISLNNSLVLRLGLRGVNRYNKRHKNSNLTFINVTKTLKHGKICSGNKEVKLLILVSANFTKKNENERKCQRLRTVYGVTKEGKGKRYKIRRQRLFDTLQNGECKQTVNISAILLNIKSVDKKNKKPKLSSTPSRRTTKMPK